LHTPSLEEVKIPAKFQLQKIKTWVPDLKRGSQKWVSSISNKVVSFVLVLKLVEQVARCVPRGS
jgi:hypothetical protein